MFRMSGSPVDRRKEMALKHVAHRWLEACAVAVFLGALLFSWQWSYGFNMGDEGWLWYISQHISFGKMPIRDTFGYDPGRYLWSAAWFKILGADGLFEQRLANASFGVIGLACAYATMQRAYVNATTRVAVTIMLAIALCYPLHKVYEQSLSLIGVALIAYVLRHSTDPRRWLILGIATGIAACIGRNSGVYYAIASCAALATTWRLSGRRVGIRSVTTYSGGLLVGYSPMVFWFILDSRFRHAMIESILFTRQWLLPLPIPFPWRVTQNISSASSLQLTMVSWLIILTIALYLIQTMTLLRRITDGIKISPLFALEAAATCVGIPYLHQSLERADFPHIAQGILPLFLLSSAQITESIKLRRSFLAILFLLIAMASWLPSEPIMHFWLLRRHDPSAMSSVTIDGHNFNLEQSTAELLRSVRRVAEGCRVGDGQLVAMPHFPGLLAYLHVQSPYWEMYYLYPRGAKFQQSEIAQMEEFGTKVAVVDWTTALDGHAKMRFEALNPILASYIRTHFKNIQTGAMPSNVNIMIRDCQSVGR